MTNSQRTKIKEMRDAGYGYSVIAAETGLSRDSIKAYCRTHNLGGIKANANSEAVRLGKCLCCDKKIIQNPSRKEKKFCSDFCRMKWWNSHPELVKRKNLHSLICRECGGAFQSKNPNQKYCSRNCYNASRKEKEDG